MFSEMLAQAREKEMNKEQANDLICILHPLGSFKILNISLYFL